MYADSYLSYRRASLSFMLAFTSASIRRWLDLLSVHPDTSLLLLYTSLLLCTNLAGDLLSGLTVRLV